MATSLNEAAQDWAKVARMHGWEPIYVGHWHFAWQRGRELVQYELDDSGRVHGVGGPGLRRMLRPRDPGKVDTLTRMLGHPERREVA